MFKHWWKKFTKMAKLPEMRLFWVVLALVVLVFVLQLFYMPPLLWGVVAVLLLAVAAISFISIGNAAQKVAGTRRERNQLRSIIGSMQDALVVYDSDFTILLFNPAAERLFGISAQEIVGQQIAPAQAEDPQRALLVQALFPTLAPQMVPRSRTGEYPQVVDLTFEDPHKELRTITSPVTTPEGEISGFMKIVRDRTREVTLLKSKNEFVSVASHQLRTPITNIEWVLESLKEEEGLSDDARELAGNALTSTTQLRDVVDDLLHIAKIEEGRFGYNFQETDIVAFLEKILAQAMPQARREGISLYFDRPDGELPAVQIDPQKLSMVVANLVDNAIRYNSENGKVTVAIAQQKDNPFIEVSVEDTGIGIPPENIDKLFTKFFRAENAKKAEAGGSGLGLYIARNIVRSHGGQMWVESELGRGSVFHFTIPIDPSLIPPQEVPIVEG